MSKRKLPTLNSSPTIGIIAPASPENREYIDKKIKTFTNLGFNIKKGRYIYDNIGYLAGKDKDRAEDLNLMFKDKTVNAIVCLRGGYGSIRMAPYIDLELIKKNPKPFFGYSDVTLLLNYISNKCKFPTFHAPMITSNFNDYPTKEYFLNIIKNTSKKLIYNLKEISNNSFSIWNKNNFSGDIVGGNLSIICSTIGTPYEINFKNNILLVEDVNENLYSVDRMLSQLISCGKLQQLSAILVGYFTNYNKENYLINIRNIFKEKLEFLNIPIIYGINIGHEHPNISIPIGCKFFYDSKYNLLIQKEIIFE